MVNQKCPGKYSNIWLKAVAFSNLGIIYLSVLAFVSVEGSVNEYF